MFDSYTLHTVTVQAIGTICRRVPQAAETGMAHLIDFLDMDAGSVRAESALAVQTLLRKYPLWRTQVFRTGHMSTV